MARLATPGTTSTDDPTPTDDTGAATERTGGQAAGRDVADVADVTDVARARAGDAAAWCAVVRRYDRLLRYIARGYRLGRDDVEDVVQQTWLICVQRIHQLQDDACFVGWLTTVCRHECTRLLGRSRRCEPVDPTTDALVGASVVLGPAPAEDVLGDLVRRDDLRNLRRAIADLPPRQREVLGALTNDRYDDYASAAAGLGVPVGSLGPTRARAVARLAADPRLALAG